MNEIFNNNPLFFALSVFSLAFHDLSKDYQTLDYYYPKSPDIKGNNIKEITIADNSKEQKSLYDSAVFRFSKQGELIYCGTNELRPSMHDTSGYFDTEHFYDSTGILIGNKLNPKKYGDKYFQKYQVIYSENPREIEFKYRDLFYPSEDTANSSKKLDTYSYQKICFDNENKILKYTIRNAYWLGPPNLYDLHEEFCSYNNDNLLSSIKVHSILNKHERNYSYFITYNRNKKIKEIIGGAINSPCDTLDIEKLTIWEHYTYDNNNRLINIFEKTNMIQKPMTTYEYFYDASGHLVKEIYQSFLFVGVKDFHYLTYKNDLLNTRVGTNSKGDTTSNFTYNYKFYD